jgi:hypothetical protein
MDDPGSLESALKDAYAAFVVTNYWETMSADVERKQGKNVANAAKVINIPRSCSINCTKAHNQIESWDPALDFQQFAEH